MGDQIHVVPGSPPWLPSPASESVTEYAYYDFPLTGVVAQSGTEYLYHCLRGSDETSGYWIYVRIDPADRRALEAAPTEEDFDRILNELLQHSRPAVVAFALEGLGLITSAIALWEGWKDVQHAFEDVARQIEVLARNASKFSLGTQKK